MIGFVFAPIQNIVDGNAAGDERMNGPDPSNDVRREKEGNF